MLGDRCCRGRVNKGPEVFSKKLECTWAIRGSCKLWPEGDGWGLASRAVGRTCAMAWSTVHLENSQRLSITGLQRGMERKKRRWYRDSQQGPSPKDLVNHAWELRCSPVGHHRAAIWAITWLQDQAGGAGEQLCKQEWWRPGPAGDGGWIWEI